MKFEIYRGGTRLTSFEPVAASAVGPESVPIAGEVTFKDGLLIVNRKDDHAAGLALLWDCGAQGMFMLETTRLQSREKPYVLNVELARFRLMKLMQKQEDWNLFDFPKVEKFTQKFQEAQNTFANALGKLDRPAEAAVLADKALEIGIEVSEQFSAFHAELLLNRRRSGSGLARHTFGVRIDPSIPNERYREAATSFDYVSMPITWRQIQPSEQVFKTEAVDEWAELLARRKQPIPLIMGPVVRLDEASVPDWMVIWEHDFDMLREMSYEFLQKIVQRYRRVVSAWNVVAGLPTNAAFSINFEQIIELTRLLVAQVKTIVPNARTLVTVTHPFGEYHARGRGSVPPMLYAEMVAQAGINFDAFGLEIELGAPAPGMFFRDLFQLSCLLDKFSTLGRPVFITALGVPGASLPESADPNNPRRDAAQGGRWKRPWDANLQADWIEAVYQLALSKPFVESIVWNNLADIHPTMRGGGLLDDMLKPKASMQRLQQVRERLRNSQKK